MAKPLLSKKNTIRKGYEAFNEADWDALGELLHPDVRWHPMKHTDPVIDGRAAVLAELARLRDKNEAEFLGTAIDEKFAIGLDFTHSTDDEGDHACADRIRFDSVTGSIIEVWHCVTHEHTAGSPASG